MRGRYLLVVSTDEKIVRATLDSFHLPLRAQCEVVEYGPLVPQIASVAATIADVILDVYGDPVPNAVIVWEAQQDTTVAPQVGHAFTDDNGYVSTGIPSGIPVLIEVPAAGIRRYLTATAGDVVTLATAIEGDIP